MLLNQKYKIDKKYFKAYRQNVMKIIEKDEHYTHAFNENQIVMLTDETVQNLYEVEKNNDRKFNDVLLKIYEQNN